MSFIANTVSFYASHIPYYYNKLFTFRVSGYEHAVALLQHFQKNNNRINAAWYNDNDSQRKLNRKEYDLNYSAPKIEMSFQELMKYMKSKRAP